MLTQRDPYPCAAVDAFPRMCVQVEAAQADLLMQLWLEPSRGGSSDAPPPASTSTNAEQQQQGQEAQQGQQADLQPEEGHEEAGVEEAGAEVEGAGEHAAGAADLEATPAEPPEAAASQLPQPHGGQYVRQFLQYLIDKNHGAMRHIPPPGLSDQTSLVSTVFALLRLMNEQVRWAGGRKAGWGCVG